MTRVFTARAFFLKARRESDVYEQRSFEEKGEVAHRATRDSNSVPPQISNLFLRKRENLNYRKCPKAFFGPQTPASR